MKRTMSGLLALAWLMILVPMPAPAGEGVVSYTPGAVEAAINRGETVLIDYKAWW